MQAIGEGPNRTRVAAMFLVALALTCSPTPSVAQQVLVVPTQFPTIQSAVRFARAGDTVRVLPGTYIEQVTIDKDLRLEGTAASSTVIQAPPTLRAFGASRTGIPLVAIIEVAKRATVEISRFTVSGPIAGICDPADASLVRTWGWGIMVHGDATIELSDSRVTGMRDEPLKGCFSGFGLAAGLAPFVVNHGETGHAVVRDVIIDDYQAVGFVVTGPATGKGSTAKLHHNRVTGAGPTSVIQQAGIVVGVNGTAIVTQNTVSRNLCTGTFQNGSCGRNPIDEFQAPGIITVGPRPGTIIAENDVLDNDVGIYLLNSPQCCSVAQNILMHNRFFGVVIHNGSNTTTQNKIRGGEVGVAVAADSVDTVGVLHEDNINGTSIAPIQEFSCCGFTAQAIVTAD